MAAAQVSPLRLAVLPTARSGEVGDRLSFFGTIINTGEDDLLCREAIGTILVGDEIVGIRVEPVDEDGDLIAYDGPRWPLAAGATQRLLISAQDFGATSGRARTHIRCNLASDAGAPSQRPIFLPGVNDFLVNFSADPQPDIIMIGDTLSGDGVARVGPTGPRAALLVAAAVNIGAPAAELHVAPRVTGFTALNALGPTVCETGADGVCLAPEADRAVVENWATGEIRFFAVRLRVPAAFGIPFYPGQLRLALDVQRPVEPDGEAGGFARPVNDGDTVWQDLSGTNTALDAVLRQGISISDGLQEGDWLSYQCRARGDHEVENRDGSSGNERENFLIDGHGAMLVSAGDGHFIPGPDGTSRVQTVGYLGGAGAGSAGVNRLYPFGFEGSLEGAEFTVVYSGELTAFGGGGATTVPQDLSQPAVLTVNPDNGGIFLTIEGEHSLFNSPFGSPGRTRCAPMPRGPGTEETNPVETVHGDHDIRNPADVTPNFPYDHGLAGLIPDPDAPTEQDRAILNGTFDPSEFRSDFDMAMQTLNAIRREQPEPGEDESDEFWRAFRNAAIMSFGLGNVRNLDAGPNSQHDEAFDVIGGLIPGRITGEGADAAAECAVLFLRDMIHPEDEPSEADRLSDAFVAVLIREGSSLDLVTAVRDCVP
ncbi:MAG: hypothetical protein KIS81_12270 [Maricaulaceae bacterium]|nr:hypothetical protein [Maricaulaceae bacterium]